MNGGFNIGVKSHATDPDKPKGVHFMPKKEQCDSMTTTDRVMQADEASFGVRRSIPGENINEWYVIEAMHSLKVLVRVSGEDDDERYD